MTKLDKQAILDRYINCISGKSDIDIKFHWNKKCIDVLLPYSKQVFTFNFEGDTAEEIIESINGSIYSGLDDMINHLGDCQSDFE